MAVKSRIKKKTTAKTTAKRKVAKHLTNGKPVVEIGVIEFHIKGGSQDGWTFSMDAMELKLVCQSVERRHELAEEDGMVMATPEFAATLSEELKEAGQPSSPAIAVAAWQMMHAYFAEVQKKTK